MNSVSGYSNAVNNLDSVQIEVLFKKKMMLIERPKHYSDFVFIFAIGIIISLTGVASAFSPYTCLQFSSSRLLHNNIWESPLVVTIKDISPYNSYVCADLQFVTFKYRSLIKAPIKLNLSVAFYLKNKIVSTLKKEIIYIARYPNYPSKASSPIRLFYYNVLNFDKIIYNISYKNIPPEAKYLATSTFRDDPSFSKLKLFVNSLLCFILSIVTVIYIKSFYIRFIGWRIEQKATLYLLFISIISHFPIFYYFYFTYPSILNTFLINAIKSIYSAYLYIYCLIISYSLSGNLHIDKKRNNFIALFIVLIITDIYHKMNPKTALLEYNSETYTNYKLFFQLENLLYFSCKIYFLYRVSKTLSGLDTRYTKKAMIYIEIFFVFLIIAISAKLVTSIFEFLKQGPLYYVVMSTLLAMAPIVMVYFHLPLHKSTNDGLMSGSDDFSTDDQIEMFPQVISID